jgi:hypothetical protein
MSKHEKRLFVQSLLRESFANFLTNRLRAQYESRDGVSSIPASDEDKYISVNKARRLLKLSHHSLLDLVKTGDIPFVIKNQDRTLRYLLRLADVERVKLTYEQAVGPRELAKQVGVDQTVIIQLVQCGRLQRKSRRTVDGYHSPKFDLDTVRRLLQMRDRLLN